LAESGWSH